MLSIAYKFIAQFRIGTCGGIGLPPGTVVVTEEAVDGRLRPFLDTVTVIANITIFYFLRRNFHFQTILERYTVMKSLSIQMTNNKNSFHFAQKKVSP